MKRRVGINEVRENTAGTVSKRRRHRHPQMHSERTAIAPFDDRSFAGDLNRVDPQLNGETAVLGNIQRGAGGNFQISGGAVEGKTLADFSGAEGQSALKDSVIRAHEVIGVA